MVGTQTIAYLQFVDILQVARAGPQAALRVQTINAAAAAAAASSPAAAAPGLGLVLRPGAEVVHHT
jgi:hypothetical protein